MDDFTPVAAVAPLADLIASLGAGRRYPLRIACLGETEVLGDDPEGSSYTVPDIVALAECASLDEAMVRAIHLSFQHDLSARAVARLGFLPRLIVILDGEQSLVLAGEPAEGGVRWCDPVASDGEARQVVEQASKLRGRASFEAGRGNHARAEDLRRRASRLECRLVDPWWRDTARRALLQAA